MSCLFFTGLAIILLERSIKAERGRRKLITAERCAAVGFGIFRRFSGSILRKNAREAALPLEKAGTMYENILEKRDGFCCEV